METGWPRKGSIARAENRDADGRGKSATSAVKERPKLANYAEIAGESTLPARDFGERIGSLAAGMLSLEV